jgi:hypothetical protein
MSFEITSNQLRAARSFLGETLNEVSERAGLNYRAVWRSEQYASEVPNSLVRTLARLVKHYESAGVQFVNRDGTIGVLFPADVGSADKED